MGKKWPMSPDVALDVIGREAGMCAVCGLHIPDGQGQIHHRRPRGMGGGRFANCLPNLLLLHGSCHLQHIELHRAEAQANGWLLQQWQSPASTPLMYMLSGWVVLEDDGSIVPVKAPQHQQKEEQ